MVTPAAFVQGVGRNSGYGDSEPALRGCLGPARRHRGTQRSSQPLRSRGIYDVVPLCPQQRFREHDAAAAAAPRSSSSIRAAGHRTISRGASWARLARCTRPREGPFSIAASVKLWTDDFMLHPFALRLMTPHGALASLRGRRQAAS